MAILYFRLIFLCNNIWTWQSQKKYSKDKWKMVRVDKIWVLKYQLKQKTLDQISE